MTTEKLSGIKACIFDAYGTLFDVHAPVARVAGKVGDDADALSRLWRQKQLEYTWLRSLMAAHVDFWQVTRDALDYALEAFGLDERGDLREELCALYLELDAYPDAAAALRQLKQAGMVTGILSNGSPMMLEAAVTSAGIGAVLDHVLSVEDVGIYKPDRRVYQMAVDATGVSDGEEICFVSANPWDAQAAAAFGFQVARIDRFGLKDDRIPGKPKLLLASLEQLPGVVG